eukprot:SAG25_NODE_126_length_14581_cov_5.819569_9_plen_85_part_00
MLMGLAFWAWLFGLADTAHHDEDSQRGIQQRAVADLVAEQLFASATHWGRHGSRMSRLSARAVWNFSAETLREAHVRSRPRISS